MAQPVKPKRNRRFSKIVISEDSKAVVLSVRHTPYKGEKLSNTKRTDHLFDPNQQFRAGRDL